MNWSGMWIRMEMRWCAAWGMVLVALLTFGAPSFAVIAVSVPAIATASCWLVFAALDRNR